MPIRRKFQSILKHPGKLWRELTQPSPQLEDIGLQRRARLLSSFLIIAAIISTGRTLFSLLTQPGYLEMLPFSALYFAITIFVYVLSRSKYYLVSASLTAAIVPVVSFVNAIANPALDTDTSLTALILGLLIGSIFLPVQGVFVLSLVNILEIGLMPVLAPEVFPDYYSVLRPFTLNIIASVLTFILLDLRNRIERDRQAELVRTAEELKHEVAERMYAEDALRARAARLELITVMGHNTTAIMEIDDLLHRAVDLMSETFGYSNVNILLVDGDDVILRAASVPVLKSQEGQVKLRIGEEGITGWVAAHGEPLLVPDVSKDSRFDMKIPVLEVKSELAVPLMLKNIVVGVLDAQSKSLDFFSQDDLYTLQAVADQLTIAIENTRLYDAARQEIEVRRQAEMALLESEARYRGIVEDQTDMICRFTLEGEITFANDAMCRSMNLERQALLGQNMFARISVKNQQQVRENLNLLNPENPTIQDEYLVVKPDGSECWEQWTDRALYDGHGQVIEYQSVGQDITERKNAELEITQLNQELERRVMERTAQLEATNKELESFAYSVSHDLRAPLRSIDGFSQVLIEDCGSQLDDQGARHVHRIQVASQRMEVLINDILKLSRTTRGEMYCQFVNLSDISERIALELMASHPERNVNFNITPDIFGFGDERLLRVVLENLIGNAWKFTGKKEIANITFGQVKIEDQLVYFVRDDGAGFDMAYANDLFRAFKRLHPDHEFEGTGIGLATVQRIIHRHHGRIWAESEVKKGAVFYFTLEIHPE